MAGKKRKWLWISLVSIVVIGLIIFFLSSGNGEAPSYVTEQVTSGTVRQTVSVTGSVVSSDEVELSFKNSGTIEKVGVKVGDQVQTGQVLAQIEAGDFQDRVDDAQSNYDLQQATLEQLQAGASSEEITVAETNVQNSELALNAAKNRLANLRNTSNADLAGAGLQVDNARSSLQALQVALADTQTSNTQSLQSAQTNVTNAQLDAENAQQSMLETQRVNAQSVASAQTALDNAENYLESMQDYLDEVQDDYDDDLATKAQVASAEAQVTQAENARDSAEEALDAAETQANLSNNTAKTQYDSAINRLKNAQDALLTAQVQGTSLLNAAQAKVDSAKISLQLAEQSLRSLQAQTQSQLSSADDEVSARSGALATSQAQLALAKKQARAVDLKPQQTRVRQALQSLQSAKRKLADSQIVASFAGTVAKVDAKVGQVSAPNVPLIKLIGAEHLQIEANISETDIAKVHLGQKAELSFDAFSTEELFYVTVNKIDPDATVVQGVIYYKVTFEFDKLDPRILPGMTANLIVVTAEVSNVVKAPLRAVETENGSFYIKVLRDQSIEPEKRLVTVGLKGDNDYEIKSGLSLGETIVTFTEIAK